MDAQESDIAKQMTMCYARTGARCVRMKSIAPLGADVKDDSSFVLGSINYGRERQTYIFNRI